MVRKSSVENFFQVRDPQKLKSSIGESPELLLHLDNLLSEWVQCQKHLPKNYDRRVARNFIRGSKFNLETCKRKFEGYFVARSSFPQFYSHQSCNSAKMREIFDNCNVVQMPNLTPEGDRIWVLALAHPGASFDFQEACKLFWMMNDITLTCSFPVVSCCFILDGSHIKNQHLALFLSAAFKNSLEILQGAYAARVSQIHIINCPPAGEKILALVRPLLPEKVRHRFLIHKKPDGLLKYFHADLLPSDFNGNSESLRSLMSQWKDILSQDCDWFKEQEQVRLLHKPPKRQFASLEGSFRQLNID